MTRTKQNRLPDLTRFQLLFESQLLGATTSSKRQLLELSRCAPDTVGLPVYGCGVPVVTDSGLHTGVLFVGVPDNRSDLVVYAGVSNEKLSQIRHADQGTYRVTGRVVSTSRIDPRLPDGYALLVMGLERTGDLQVSATDVARTARADVRERVVSQLNASDREWARVESGSEPEATATPTGDGVCSSPSASQTDGQATVSELRVTEASVNRSEVAPLEDVAVSITLLNTDCSAAMTADPTIERDDGFPVNAVGVSIPPGETRTVSFVWTPVDTGDWTLLVGGKETVTVSVSEDSGIQTVSGDSDGSGSGVGSSSQGSGVQLLPKTVVGWMGVSIAAFAWLGLVAGLVVESMLYRKRQQDDAEASTSRVVPAVIVAGSATVIGVLLFFDDTFFGVVVVGAHWLFSGAYLATVGVSYVSRSIYKSIYKRL